MLNTEKIFVRSNCLKSADSSSFSVLDYVTCLIRHTESEKASNKASYKSGKEALEEAHADIDVLTATEDVVRPILKEDTDAWLKDRDEVVALKEAVRQCIPFERVTSLAPADLVHITLIAHTSYSGVLLNADLFDPDKDGVDFSKAVNMFYQRGQVNSDVKDLLKKTLTKVLGSEGEYFYGVAPKKTDFDKEDVMHFLARFSKRASRSYSKNKKTKVITWGDFKYQTKTDMETQRRAFTEFCAVVLDNASKHSVLKPEEVKEVVEK